MKRRVVADLSQLPLHGLGSASLTFWGTLGFMLLEGTGFALGVGIYLYLMSLAPEWPLGAPPPNLAPGVVMSAFLLVSLIPNHFVARWAHEGNLKQSRVGIVIMTIAGVIPLVIRYFEFTALNTRWDSNAYGSIVWTLLGLHTTHLITDLGDTVVLAFVMFTRHGDNRRRYGDLQDNAMYWNFVVATWIPVYLCIYWAPRL